MLEIKLTYHACNNSHRKVINFLFRHLGKYFPITARSHYMMASPKYLFFVPILCQIILLLLISHLPNILSQDSSPTIAQCTPSLLLLIPCTTFVQGTSPSPGSACCGNLKQLYSQEPRCLCLFLNGTNLRSLPINRTLALQLPALCSLQVNANMSACLGYIKCHIQS